MRSKPVRESKATNVYIYKVKAWCYDKAVRVDTNRYPSKVNGLLEVHYSGTSKYSDQVIAEFPLTSVWLDPGKSGTLKVCKAVAQVPQHPKTENQKNAVDLINFMLNMNGVRELGCNMTAGSYMFSVDDSGKVVRFGTSYEALPYTSRGEDGYSERTPIYDNKAQAFAAVLDSIKSYQLANVSGIDLINLNAVSDEILEEIGFVKVPDQMDIGVPMWMGDAQKIMSLGRSSYGAYRGSRYGHDDGEQDVSSKQVVESFLDLVEMDLVGKD